MEHEVDSDTTHSQNTRNNPKEPAKETEGTGDTGKDWNCPDHS